MQLILWKHSFSLPDSLGIHFEVSWEHGVLRSSFQQGVRWVFDSPWLPFVTGSTLNLYERRLQLV